MSKTVFDLYEQFATDKETRFLVELDYEPNHPSDFHGLYLSLRRPDDFFAFAEIIIEYRDGTPRILVWGDPNEVEGDPTVFESNPADAAFCLKCGCEWSIHNGDGSCVEEN